MKKTFKGATLMYPLPAVMVSCGRGDEANIITVAWTGIINSEPPMTYVSVRPSRHSHDIIEKEGEFVINMTDENLVYEMDYCGCVSGSKVNKWEKLGLTKEAADKVSCPMIAESPLNLECRVVDVKKLPSHDMFIAEIVAVHADEKLMNSNGRLALERAGLVTLVHSGYHKCTRQPLGRMGYSVMKPSTKKRLAREGKRVSGAKPHKKHE
jgi:flavin reductase (DIM6/NTAB) family NADH-FMN oxidoreductase RutF